MNLNVFIGYDPRQPIAYQVLSHSIWKHAKRPVSITRLQLNQLPITRRGLTEFTISRYLSPWLCGFQGISVFLDADMLALGDITPLHDMAIESEHPVLVVKNKLRFEWPSLMVFKNDQCQKLTPEYIQNDRNRLADFSWASSVGELPSEWNHLVGYDSPQQAKVVHYTKGIPIWPQTLHSEYAAEWHEMARETRYSVSYDELMGGSVHARGL